MKRVPVWCCGRRFAPWPSEEAFLATGNRLTVQSENQDLAVAPPADVVLFSDAFARHLRIPFRAREVMRQNLETRLRFRFEELHIPTLAQTMTAPALIIHDREDADVPYAHGQEIAQAWPRAELITTKGLGHRAGRYP